MRGRILQLDELKAKLNSSSAHLANRKVHFMSFLSLGLEICCTGPLSTSSNVPMDHIVIDREAVITSCVRSLSLILLLRLRNVSR